MMAKGILSPTRKAHLKSSRVAGDALVLALVPNYNLDELCLNSVSKNVNRWSKVRRAARKIDGRTTHP